MKRKRETPSRVLGTGGSVIEYATGLGTLRFTHYTDDLTGRRLGLAHCNLGIESVIHNCRNALDGDLPEHVKAIAINALVFAEKAKTLMEWEAPGKSPPWWEPETNWVENLCQSALKAGFLYQRFQLARHEADAASGEARRIAAGRPRGARTGSIREFLNTIPSWRSMTLASLRGKVRGAFPKRDVEAINRELLRLKKDGH